MIFMKIQSVVKLLGGVIVLLGVGRGLHSTDDFQKTNGLFLVPPSISQENLLKSSCYLSNPADTHTIVN